MNTVLILMLGVTLLAQLFMVLWFSFFAAASAKDDHAIVEKLIEALKEQ